MIGRRHALRGRRHRCSAPRALLRFARDGRCIDAGDRQQGASGRCATLGAEGRPSTTPSALPTPLRPRVGGAAPRALRHRRSPKHTERRARSCAVRRPTTGTAASAAASAAASGSLRFFDFTMPRGGPVWARAGGGPPVGASPMPPVSGSTAQAPAPGSRRLGDGRCPGDEPPAAIRCRGRRALRGVEARERPRRRRAAGLGGDAAQEGDDADEGEDIAPALPGARRPLLGGEQRWQPGAHVPRPELAADGAAVPRLAVRRPLTAFDVAIVVVPHRVRVALDPRRPHRGGDPLPRVIPVVEAHGRVVEQPREQPHLGRLPLPRVVVVRHRVRVRVRICVVEICERSGARGA